MEEADMQRAVRLVVVVVAHDDERAEVRKDADCRSGGTKPNPTDDEGSSSSNTAAVATAWIPAMVASFCKREVKLQRNECGINMRRRDQVCPD